MVISLIANTKKQVWKVTISQDQVQFGYKPCIISGSFVDSSATRSITAFTCVQTNSFQWKICRLWSLFSLTCLLSSKKICLNNVDISMNCLKGLTFRAFVSKILVTHKQVVRLCIFTFNLFLSSLTRGSGWGGSGVWQLYATILQHGHC